MKKRGARGDKGAVAGSQSMQRARIAYTRGEWPEAERWCQQVLEVRGDCPDALNLLGVIAAQMGRAKEAACLLGRAVTADPGNATAHNNYGNVLQELKRFDDALASYECALTLNPDYAEAYNNRASTVLELERFEEALNSLNKAVDCDHRFSSAYERLGALLNGMGHTGLAAAIYGRWTQPIPPPNTCTRQPQAGICPNAVMRST